MQARNKEGVEGRKGNFRKTQSPSRENMERRVDAGQWELHDRKEERKEGGRISVCLSYQ